MEPDIEVEAARSGDGWDCTVRVRADAGRSEHRVRVPQSAWQDLTGGRAPVEELLQASFAFLLEREPPSAILRSFEVSVIARYFPEYPAAMARRFGGRSVRGSEVTGR